MCDAREPRQPRRPHFLIEWMEAKGVIAARLAEDLEVAPGVISNWRNGTSFGARWQKRLADYFNTTQDALFFHPDVDKLRRVVAGRSSEEIDRIIEWIERFMPRAKPLPTDALAAYEPAPGLHERKGQKPLKDVNASSALPPVKESRVEILALAEVLGGERGLPAAEASKLSSVVLARFRKPPILEPGESGLEARRRQVYEILAQFDPT